jgi:hypothetical protein
MKSKKAFYTFIFFCGIASCCIAQQKVCLEYSFPTYSSNKSTSSNIIINSFIGNTIVGVANSSSSIIRTSSLLNMKKLKDNTAEMLENSAIPTSYSLDQNYPNPFNPTTQIRFSIPKESFVRLTIYNTLGSKVDELVNEVKAPGTYVIEWNAKNYTSGVYIYNLRSGSYSFTKKLILLK